MPYKSGKLKGELTNAEIRKLIREHNKLVSMKVPVKATREQIIKAVEDKGYTVDHINQRLKPKSAKISGKTVTRNPSIKLSDVPKKVSKPKKVVMKSAPKEDEVRPARIGAPPIPKAKDFVKVGVKPKKQARIDTNAPRNVGKVDTTKPKKEDKTKNPGVGFKIADYLKKRGLKLKPRDFSSIAKVLNSGKIKSLTLSPGDAFIGFTGPDDTRYAYSVFNRIVLKKPKKTAKEGTPKKEKKKKLKKDIKQDIEYGIELTETGMAEKDKIPKDRCKDYVYASKKIIQADKDNFKKIRLFDKDASSWISSFGNRFKSATSLLKLYEVFENVSNWDDTIDRIKKDCGVQETLFVETAYDILYRKWDEVKDAIVKQNIKKNPDIASKLKKPRQIEYQYYEPGKVKKAVEKIEKKEKKPKN